MPVHHLMVGTWTPPGAIFTFAFDDEALTLNLIKRTEIPQDEPISWMTFDAASASSPETNTRAIFLLAARKPPYAVYCNHFYSHAGHGSVFTTDSSTGALAANVQNYPYQPDTGIHGMVFDPTETYLYSADLKANKLWVHRRPDPESPEIELIGSVPCPDPRDHPRWVAMHPSGQFLYVLMEKGNRICEYRIDPENHLPYFTDRHFPLIPPGIPDRWTQYRADVCALSHSGKYLFASSRANSFDLTGYIAAFKISPEGSIERQICLNPTPTSGGHSNAVSPSDWTDEWVAITDDQEGWLEIYRWQDEFLARVARVRVPEPGFGMNAIWYD
ncbi:Carboxy-cis,cis-muconate cyclase [Cladobotryum mycophilum]|uniref:Carboxy-cis,cis-muconate cyclase n=1 Tax=Cladobotryum mycophilum TaxID=491253 RepID=A0ABR0S6U1_9HYPO